MAATDTASPSPIPAPRFGFPPASPMPPASPIPDPSPMPKGSVPEGPRVERERPARSLTMLMLEAEARYARDHYELYRARAYGPRLTSARRLRELERKSKFAEIRLDRARADQGPVASVDDEHFFWSHTDAPETLGLSE
jgi:hypothetical protein